jgi:hypothetical protein
MNLTIKGDYISMRKILTVSALLLLTAGTALAGSEYDRCIKEEKALKVQEAGDCSGLSYLLNPSACFATQKALKEYTSTGKCKKIGIAEHVDFSAVPVIQEKKSGSVSKAGVAGPAVVKKAEAEVARQEGSCEQLKDENARLKAEISRLTAELEQYTKACR